MDPGPDEQVHPGTEDLSWTREKAMSLKGKKPDAKYTRISETARSLISSEKQCALFCGGKKCKYCCSDGWTRDEMVITGLYSNWITDNIVAIARPSNSQIKKYKMIDQFKQHGIKSLVNLQIPGEHSACGDTLDPSGFSYNPQTFMESGIFFYNFGWPDYGVGSLSTIMDMVKVMQFAITEGKIAVHCHAGKGRTGVIIACYLVFTNRMSADDAIHYVRSRRPGTIQTRGQMECVQQFDQYLKPFRVVFASKTSGSHEFSLQQYLNRQKHILHGYEARKLKFVPKIIYMIVERLLELSRKKSSLSKLQKPLNYQTVAKGLPKAFGNKRQISRTDSNDSIKLPPIRSHRTFAALRDTMRSFSAEELTEAKFPTVLTDDCQSETSTDSTESRPSQTSMQDVGRYWDEDGDECATEDDDESRVVQACLKYSKIVYREKDRIGSDSKTLSVELTVDGIMASTYTEECWELVEKYETDLNLSEQTWTNITMETNAYALSAVMWDWMDHLKEPILRSQDLTVIQSNMNDPSAGLQRMEKGTRHTIEYILKAFTKLKPLDEELEVTLYEKLLSHLTHQWVHLDSSQLSAPSSRPQEHRTEVKSVTASKAQEHWTEMKSVTAFILLTFFLALVEKFQKHR